MIRPQGFRGAAFGTLAEGDLRRNGKDRERVSEALGVSPAWAYLNQVHGDGVVEVVAAGLQGDGDAMFTTKPDLPLVVGTADCVPVVLEGPEIVAVIHAGWRGAVAGVVSATLDAVAQAGHTIDRAAIGPAIGPRCYEVGDEVAANFPNFVRTTSWGTQSIDLPGSIAAELEPLPVWQASVCTYSSDLFASHRRDGTPQRQVAVAWLPKA